MNINIIDIFTGLGALATVLGVPTILTIWVKGLLKERQLKREQNNSFTSTFEGVHKVYHLLQVMLNHSEANRVVLLKTMNGGGKPSLTSKLNSSVIYEAFKNPLESVKDRWQKQQIDKSYIEMLYEMNKTGSLDVFTDEGEHDGYVLAKGLLKTLYRKDKVIKSRVFKIAERDKEYIYLSVNYSRVSKESSDNVEDLFRYSVSNLRNLFTKNAKI